MVNHGYPCMNVTSLNWTCLSLPKEKAFWPVLSNTSAPMTEMKKPITNYDVIKLLRQEHGSATPALMMTD